VLIYSVPQFTGVAVEAVLTTRLAEHANIVGIKESSGNVHRVAEIIHMAPPGFLTLVGSASTFYASLAVGAVGGILGLACALPELCVELYDVATAGHADRARDLQHRLLDAGTIIVGRFGVAGVKYALDRLGYIGGAPRPPLLPLPEPRRREVDGILDALAVSAART
jgi:4-hydroxy-2-oxoglutarate aldolase